MVLGARVLNTGSLGAGSLDARTPDTWVPDTRPLDVQVLDTGSLDTGSLGARVLGGVRVGGAPVGLGGEAGGAGLRAEAGALGGRPGFVAREGRRRRSRRVGSSVHRPYITRRPPRNLMSRHFAPRRQLVLDAAPRSGTIHQDRHSGTGLLYSP